MELVVAFLANQSMRGLSEATIRRRTWTLRTFETTIVPLETARTVDVERFLAARPTAATRRALLGDLRAFYRWAIGREHLTFDPTVPVEQPKIPKRLPTPISRDELQRAWDSAGFQLRCVLALGAFAGLRMGEIAALTMDDVDFTYRTITVRNGKGGKDRVVPMASVLAELLRHAGPGRVLPYANGASVGKAVHRLFVRLEIPHRPHDLRHSFATELARVSSGNMLLVSQLLGHASLQTTQRYTAALPVGLDVVEELWRHAA